MIYREIFTYPKKLEIANLIVNKKFKIFDFKMEQCSLLQQMDPFQVTL